MNQKVVFKKILNEEKEDLNATVRPEVSIIIVNYNGLKWLEGCFSSLQNQTYQNFEVIFVDNCSLDSSVSFVRENYPKTSIIQNKENYGFATGNNLGYKVAQGKYILLLNNDTLLENDYLENFVKVFVDYPKCGMAQSKLLLMSDKNLVDSAGSFWTSSTFLNHYGYLKKDNTDYSLCYPVFSAKGASLLIKREVLDVIGLFDDDFWCYYEDTDLCHRSWLAGYEVWYYPKAVCYHNLGSTSSLFDRGDILFHSFKNKYLSFVKNFELVKMLKFLVSYSVVLSLYQLIMLLRGEYKIARCIFRSQAYLVMHFFQIWKKRGQVQKLRQVRDREFLQKLTKEMSFKDYLKSI